MEIDAAVAAALGWPKTKYAKVERERRWLCDHVPHADVASSGAVVDIYVSGTQLRLRKTTDLKTGQVQFKLSRKADISASKRIITTLYLSAAEFALLSNLPGERVEKTRYTVADKSGQAVTIDRFGGRLAGLILGEVEFANDEAMNSYRAPDFLGREVTEDRRYTGFRLAVDGLPGA